MDDDVVRQAPLFAALDDEAAQALRSTMTRVEVPPRRGDLPRGRPRRPALRHRRGQDQAGPCVRATGARTCWRSSAPARCSASCRSSTPARATRPGRPSPTPCCIGVGNDDLDQWLRGRPDVARHLLRALARRLRRTNEALADLVFSDVPGRVAKALLDLSERFGRPTDDGLRVAHDLTQEELAQLVGASRETVNKALADFASRGWLRLEARAVVLLDIDRLRKRAR